MSRQQDAPGKAARRALMDYLDEHGQKLTSQRSVILDVFLAAREHLTAEELYLLVRKLDDKIGQATVYRTLKLFCEAGVAREVAFGDGAARYEPAQTKHHDHLICQGCGAQLEVVDPEIERLQEELAARHGYRLTGHAMYLYGLCPDCYGQGES